LPGETEKWQFVEKAAREVFETFDFSEVKIPVLEKTELFTRSIGKTTDIVEKEMYTFLDRKGDSLTLRPEATASVVRAYIEHKLYKTNSPVKLYSLGPMFRYERPQKGRFRQFYQINAESFGQASPRMDGEVISLALCFFQKVGLMDLDLQINSLGCCRCRMGFKDELRSFLKDRTSDLCADCRRRLEVNPLRTLDCKEQGCKEVVFNAPSIVDFLCEDCSDHFREFKRSLTSLKIPYQVNPRIVRGLDYYTRTTFEIISPKLGAQDAVAGGGRYDNLVSNLGGPDIPAVGFAIGWERLVSLLSEEDESFLRPLQLFIAALGKDALEEAYKLVNRFRLSGIKAEASYEEKSLKSQMRRANKLNSRFVLIIGEEEFKSKKAILRDMEKKRQEDIDLKDAVSEIIKRAEGRSSD
jgi:histidyl-tRNA synthetase